MWKFHIVFSFFQFKKIPKALPLPLGAMTRQDSCFCVLCFSLQESLALFADDMSAYVESYRESTISY